MSSKGFRFARDVRRQERAEKIHTAVVVGLTLVGAWSTAVTVYSFRPLLEAPTHPGEGES